MKIIFLLLIVLLVYLLPELFRDRRSGRYQYPDSKPRLPGSNRLAATDDRLRSDQERASGEQRFSEREAARLAVDSESLPPPYAAGPADSEQPDISREWANFIIMAEIIQPPLAFRRNYRFRRKMDK